MANLSRIPAQATAAAAPAPPTTATEPGTVIGGRVTANAYNPFWQLLFRDQNDTLPVLVPRGEMGADPASKFTGGQVAGGSFLPTRIYSSVRAQDPIDVINNFKWTKSPISSRNDTPAITLVEKRLAMNSNVTNLANSVFATLESAEQAKAAAQDFVNPLITQAAAIPYVKNTAGLVGINTESLSNTVTSITQSVASLTTDVAKGLRDSITKVATDNFDVFKSPVLTPYNYLYSTEPTGFTYILPYFENTYTSNKLQFGEESDKSFVSGVADIFGNIAAGAAGIAGMFKPGVYIEKAKQYTMGSNGRSINVKFPLLNTDRYADIAQNWQLIFALLYQNRPGRVTRSIIDMPVIYETKIEGVVYMPYSFISSLAINFLGNRRQLSFNVPIGSPDGTSTTTNITTIVPDAYEVEMTIEGMNEETRNFLYVSTTSSGVTVGNGALPEVPSQTSAGPTTVSNNSYTGSPGVSNTNGEPGGT